MLFTFLDKQQQYYIILQLILNPLALQVAVLIAAGQDDTINAEFNKFKMI